MSVEAGGGPFFEMRGAIRCPQVPTYSRAQESSLGKQLAIAIGEGRAFEVREGESQAILILVSAADDLGHVYEIDKLGLARDIGVTEAVATA